MAENNTWQYIVGIIVTGLLVIWNYFENFIKWFWFIVIAIIIIAGYFIIENIIKKRNAIIPVQEKQRIPTEIILEIIDDYTIYCAEELDMDNSMSFQLIEDRAFEETMKSDMPVTYLQAVSNITKDKYDIIIRSEKKDTIDVLIKMAEKGIKNKLYYSILRKSLIITITKNLSGYGKEKQEKIRYFINAHANKSGLGFFQFDPQTKKFTRHEVIENPEEKDDEEEDEE